MFDAQLRRPFVAERRVQAPSVIVAFDEDAEPTAGFVETGVGLAADVRIGAMAKPRRLSAARGRRAWRAGREQPTVRPTRTWPLGRLLRPIGRQSLHRTHTLT